MLQKEIVSTLQKGRSLLAFSGGGDSTALFFLLLEHKIPFDIAIVDYNLRQQSKEEVAYARELAKVHNLHCFVKEAPKIETNFEANARKFRYDFFQSLIEKNRYNFLLTAHHLGDRLEWFLMQLCKGAGFFELAGMKMVERRENYTLVRPLLGWTKAEIEHYLNSNDIHYFQDSSNNNLRYTRNRFRHHFAMPLLEKYADGIKRSFTYIDEDRETFCKGCNIALEGTMAYFQTSHVRCDLLCIDTYLKNAGHLLSASEKEVIKKRENCIVGRRFLITFYKKHIFITPYNNEKIVMPKSFKEECRRHKIEPKMRPYLFRHQEAFALLLQIT